MNKIHSINNPVMVNGVDMKDSDFGIVRESNPDTCLNIGKAVFKANGKLVCLEDGLISDKPERYEVEIKDNLTLQRIK